MENYYPLRRVPHAVSSAVLWTHLHTLVGPLIRSVAANARASLPFPKDLDLRRNAEERAREAGDAVTEMAQHIYFDNPGLDTVTVRTMSRLGRNLTYLWARIMRLRVAAHMDPDGRAARNLRALPKTGYDALMMTGLAIGEVLGYFRGGPVTTKLWWDSHHPDQEVNFEPPHRRPRVRRFDAPTSLGALSADIDDMYWADAYGQPIKVTRVGEGASRRWLVSLPGTDHFDYATRPNPADLEANMREELNMPNAMRRATIDTIRLAMAMDGVPDDAMVGERVLICGHSQGGMVAMALASIDPKEVGFTVDRVLTLGSPTRRLRLRPDAVAVAVEHDQDIIPSMDGTPRRNADQRITIGRKLNPPRMNPLFYAHSSSTYTETVRRIERQHEVAPWGRRGKAVELLQAYLPREGEPNRVFHFYAWQEVSDVKKAQPWDQVFALDFPQDWQPVRYEGDIEVDPDVAVLLSKRVADFADNLKGNVALLGKVEALEPEATQEEDEQKEVQESSDE